MLFARTSEKIMINVLVLIRGDHYATKLCARGIGRGSVAAP